MESHILTGVSILEKMVGRLPTEQRAAFDAAARSGYLVVRPEQQELQRVWSVWCMQQQQADVRVEEDGEFNVVTMHLAPAHSTLSGDGMIAVRRSFERYGQEGLHYQTRTWCKHPRVWPQSSRALARHLVEIAYLDGVAQ